MSSSPSFCAIVITAAVISLASIALATSCDSCGNECKRACGTRRFKACCFNYIKKRNEDSQNDVPGVRLELVMVVPESVQDYAQPFEQDKSHLEKIEEPVNYLKTFGLV